MSGPASQYAPEAADGTSLPTLEDHLREQREPWRTSIPTFVLWLLEGRVPPRYDDLQPEDRAHVLNDGLRWAVSDGAEVRLQWQAVARCEEPKLPERDAIVAALWGSIRTGETEGFRGLRNLIVDGWGGQEHYERALFAWFLGRFDLVRARGVFHHAQLTVLLHWLLLAFSLFALWALLTWWPLGTVTAIGSATAGMVLLLACKPLSGLRSADYLQSLVPRLGAAVALGYLFLAAAPELVRVIYEQGLPGGGGTTQRSQLLLATCLLAGTIAYTMLHIHRRVHPELRPRALLWRAVNLVATALIYAVLGLGVAAPLLFHPSLLYHGVNPLPQVDPGPHQLALCAAIALGLGMVLQLAWEEKPLTEPL